MLKASAGSSGFAAPVKRPTHGVVEACSVTGSFDAFQPGFDTKIVRAPKAI
jgi:hypothetical protein